MQDHIFRMYDIRGKVGSEFLISQVRECAHAIAYYYKQLDPSVQTLGVAMDGRSHSPAIKKELVEGLQESGINVVFFGVCPTPVAYFAQYYTAIDGVLMITASHNPADYNGIKLSLRKQSLHGVQLQDLARAFKERKKITTTQSGTYKEQAIITAYIQNLLTLFPHLKGITLPLIFDTGHGAVGAVMPKLMAAFKWPYASVQCSEVASELAVHEADPTKEENVKDLKNALQKKTYALACAFDGDGDRLGALTHDGKLIPGDVLLTLFAGDVLQTHSGAWIVCDSKSSDTVEEVIQKQGGHVYRSLTGHSFIKKSMAQVNALLAGELSGHFFFADRYYGFDDGIYTALRLLELIIKKETSLAALVAALPQRITSPEYRVACDQEYAQMIVTSMIDFFQQQGLIYDTLDGVRVTTQQGWALIRASNTQPMICFRFESKTEKGINDIQMLCNQALENIFKKGFLDRKMPWQEI